MCLASERSREKVARDRIRQEGTARALVQNVNFVTNSKIMYQGRV